MMDEQLPKTRDQPSPARTRTGDGLRLNGHRSDSLLIDDQDRYSRLRLISWWRQERLRAARVLVVGAGAWATRS